MSKKHKKSLPAPQGDPLYSLPEGHEEFTLDAFHAVTYIDSPYVSIFFKSGGKAEFVALGFVRVVTDQHGIHRIYMNADAERVLSERW